MGLSRIKGKATQEFCCCLGNFFLYSFYVLNAVNNFGSVCASEVWCVVLSSTASKEGFMNVLLLFSRNSPQTVWLEFLLGWDTVTKSNLGKTGSILSYNSVTLWGLKEETEASQLSYTVQDHELQAPRGEPRTCPAVQYGRSTGEAHKVRLPARLEHTQTKYKNLAHFLFSHPKI